MNTMSDKEVMINENEYSEEEVDEGKDGEQTSQEVPIVSKEDITSSTTAINEEIMSSLTTNEEIALSPTSQLPTNGYSAEQLNQMYWWPYYQQQTINTNNNGSQFQPSMSEPPQTGSLQMPSQPTGNNQIPEQPNGVSSQMPPYMMPYYFMPPPMTMNGSGTIGWPQNYWPMAGPSTSVSGDNGEPSTSSSAKTKPSKAKVYTCRLCSHMNYIKDVQQFRMHIEKHLSPKHPFKCDICNKLFTYKSICRNHVMAHCVVRPTETTSSGGQQ
ncbi:protein odd-skipped-like [Oppia nitens]|uniref:protein odd-skipped-like n=1 Tax=Oppia nitens TaxID=1686743 RepID=UPI0023DCCBBD|nr:protein odd-skipped-like [Oppia nitens]